MSHQDRLFSPNPQPTGSGDVQQPMNKDEFYKTMEAFHKDMPDDVVSRNWRKCFVYALSSTYKDFPAAAAEILFDRFDMDNWKAMWKEHSPEYKDSTIDQMKEAFAGECHYISDRISFDRVFRTHWLYKRAYKG